MNQYHVYEYGNRIATISAETAYDALDASESDPELARDDVADYQARKAVNVQDCYDCAAR